MYGLSNLDGLDDLDWRRIHSDREDRRRLDRDGVLTLSQCGLDRRIEPRTHTQRDVRLGTAGRAIATYLCELYSGQLFFTVSSYSTRAASILARLFKAQCPNALTGSRKDWPIGVKLYSTFGGIVG